MDIDVTTALSSRPQTRNQIADRFAAQFWCAPPGTTQRLRQEVLRQLVALRKEGTVIGSPGAWRLA